MRKRRPGCEKKTWQGYAKYPGEVFVAARRWARKSGWPRLTNQLAERFARAYREQMEVIKDAETDCKPPCVRCNDLTLYFCGTTGYECQNFLTYCNDKGG